MSIDSSLRTTDAAPTAPRCHDPTRLDDKLRLHRTVRYLRSMLWSIAGTEALPGILWLERCGTLRELRESLPAIMEDLVPVLGASQAAALASRALHDARPALPPAGSHVEEEVCI